jgi:hypothetical protein
MPSPPRKRVERTRSGRCCHWPVPACTPHGARRLRSPPRWQRVAFEFEGVGGRLPPCRLGAPARRDAHSEIAVNPRAYSGQLGGCLAESDMGGPNREPPTTSELLGRERRLLVVLRVQRLKSGNGPIEPPLGHPFGAAVSRRSFTYIFNIRPRLFRRRAPQRAAVNKALERRPERIADSTDYRGACAGRSRKATPRSDHRTSAGPAGAFCHRTHTRIAVPSRGTLLIRSQARSGRAARSACVSRECISRAAGASATGSSGNSNVLFWCLPCRLPGSQAEGCRRRAGRLPGSRRRSSRRGSSRPADQIPVAIRS